MANQKPKIIVVLSTVVLTVAILVSAVLIMNRYERDSDETIQPATDTEIVSVDGVDYVPKKGITTFLVVGLDADSNGQDSAEVHKQADFIVLFILDSENRNIRAVHINRDTVTEMNLLALDGSKAGTSKQPIALAYAEGDGREMSCKNTAAAVSNLLLGTKIDYFASFTMDTVSAINDSVGGISVTVEDDMTSVDPSFEKGKTVTLFGEKALKFVRARGGLEDSSNIKRMTRQRQYLINLFSTVRDKLKTDDNFVIDLFPKISDGIITNCSLNRMDSILDKSSGYAFTGFTDIEGESTIGEKFMEFHPDRAALEKTVVELFYKKKQD